MGRPFCGTQFAWLGLLIPTFLQRPADGLEMRCFFANVGGLRRGPAGGPAGLRLMWMNSS